jgi:hypothetical protein
VERGFDSTIDNGVFEVVVLEKISQSVASGPAYALIATCNLVTFLLQIVLLHQEYATSIEPFDPDAERYLVCVHKLDDTILALLPLLLERVVDVNGVGPQQNFVNVVLLLRCADADEDWL